MEDAGGGTLRAEDPGYQSKVEAAYELSGDSLTTMSYLGKRWVVCIFPFAA